MATSLDRRLDRRFRCSLKMPSAHAMSIAALILLFLKTSDLRALFIGFRFPFWMLYLIFEVLDIRPNF